MKNGCCSALTSCANDVNCTCWIQCFVIGQQSLGDCLTQCQGPSGATSALEKCAEPSCDAVCPIGGAQASSSSAASTGSGPSCNVDPNASVCLQCTQQSCCAGYLACLADLACPCWLDCYLVKGGDLNACTQQCGPPPQTAIDLGSCTGQTCGCP